MIKGGILVTAMVGVALRSTMDIDTSITNQNISEELAAVLNPAILLCGGPGWAYAGKALDAFDQMSEDK